MRYNLHATTARMGKKIRSRVERREGGGREGHVFFSPLCV